MSRAGRALTIPLLVGLVALSFALAGCGGSNRITATASFTDVGDLATYAPVWMDNVQVGKVTSIRLAGDRALVTMSIDKSAQVPAGVTAQIGRTSVLGERIVQLIVPASLPASAPVLADGQRIENTTVQADLEDFVNAGNTLLAPITASEVATLVDEGYKGFGQNGQALRGLLDNFQRIVSAYSTRTGQIQSVIDSLNQLNSTIAPDAGAQALSLRNSAHALDVLREESDRLKAALHALSRLSIGARGIMDAHEQNMEDFFAQMRTILGVLQQDESAILGFLQYAPLHNRNTQLVNYQQFNQVIQDFVICGLNSNPNDPARRC